MARLLLPAPDTPVMTTTWPGTSSRSMPFRLWVSAPSRIVRSIQGTTVWGRTCDSQARKSASLHLDVKVVRFQVRDGLPDLETDGNAEDRAARQSELTRIDVMHEIHHVDFERLRVVAFGANVVDDRLAVY